ncbi:kinase-like protein, partial [Fistulina hepatica ATCC 64428]
MCFVCLIQVMVATYKRTAKQFAIKILDKKHLQRHNKARTAVAEKNALVALGSGHPGIVKLWFTFQDDWSLYFVLDLVRNGEMQALLYCMGSFSLKCSRYYAAQLLDAMAYMHSKNVIHRDLKPENLLLDDFYRLKITDFGTGKVLDGKSDGTKTYVGTAQYVAPELLLYTQTSKSSDFWAFACIVYQMIAGRFTFQGLSEYLTYEKIKRIDYTFPEGFDDSAKDVVERILASVRDPDARLGVGEPGSVNDLTALRSHSFFAAIDWDNLWSGPAPPLE